MKRTSTIRVRFGESFAEATIRTSGGGKHFPLTRDESQKQHDVAVDRVVDALRTLPYVGTAPLRNVRIR